MLYKPKHGSDGIHTSLLIIYVGPYVCFIVKWYDPRYSRGHRLVCIPLHENYDCGGDINDGNTSSPLFRNFGGLVVEPPGDRPPTLVGLEGLHRLF